MRKLLSLFALLSSAQLGYSQQFQWVKEYAEFTQTVTSTSDAIYAAGRNILAVKYDKTGNAVWTKKYTSAYLSGNDIKVDALGNVYVAGSFNGTATTGDTTLKATVGETFIARLDAQGNIAWIRQSTSYDAAAQEIYLTDDNGLIVRGYFSGNSFTFGGKSATGAGNNDGYLMKLNSNGNAEWIYRMGGSENDMIKTAVITGNNTLLVAGEYMNAATLNATDLPAKTGRTGFKATLNTADGTVSGIEADNTFFYQKIYKAGSSYYMAASFQGDKTIAGKTFSSPQKTSGLLIKGDESFTPAWASMVTNTEISTFDVQSDGSVLAGGTFTGQIKVGDSYTFNNKGEIDIYLASYEADGTVEWAIQPSGEMIDGLYSIKTDNSDNSFYVLGTVQMGPADLGNLQIQGNFSGSSFMAKTGEPSGIKGHHKIMAGIDIFPNPTSGVLTIKMAEIANGTVNLVSMSGQVVRNTPIHSQSVKMDVSELPKGLYVVNILTAQGTESTLVEIGR